MSHTPEPWVIIDGVVTCPDGFPLYTGERPEYFANVHLVAAAPDLLEACKDAHEWLSIVYPPEIREKYQVGKVNEVLDNLTLAIAKAEGQG